MELVDKIAVVTGVSKGIGKATVEALLKEGCNVVGWGRTAPNIDHTNFYFFETDVKDMASVQNAYHATVNRLGHDISILVNNAGLGYEAMFDEMTPEQWHTMFKTNVDGIFYCTRQILPDMKRLGEAHIFNIASIAGTTGIPGMSGYCATKFAVRGLTQSLYKEVRNFGVKVTCIYPGSVKTNFFDDIDSVTVNDNMMRPEDIAETIVQSLHTHPNYHQVDIEVRPLKPKG